MEINNRDIPEVEGMKNIAKIFVGRFIIIVWYNILILFDIIIINMPYNKYLILL